MKSFLRKLLPAPLYLLVVAVGGIGPRIGRFLRKPAPLKVLTAMTPGISVLIPERANREMLQRCLESLGPACAAHNEPVEIVVVVTGAESDGYRELMKEFPARWLFQLVLAASPRSYGCMIERMSEEVVTLIQVVRGSDAGAARRTELTEPSEQGWPA